MSCWEPSNKGAIFGPMAAPVRADALRRRTMSIHSYTLIRLPFAGADAGCSLDHLVGASEQRRWHVETKCPWQAQITEFHNGKRSERERTVKIGTFVPLN